MPWRPGRRFPTGPFPGRRPAPYPRFPRRRARAFYAPVGQDAPGGRILNANTLYTTLITAEAATSPATVGQIATDDYYIRRVFGLYHRELAAKGSDNVGQLYIWHSALAVLDEDPVSGTFETAQYVNFWQGSFTRRLYWRANWFLGFAGTSETGATIQLPYSTFLQPPFNGMSGDQVDFQLLARCRPDQRFAMLEYVEGSGTADATFRSVMQLKALASMTTEMRRF